MILVVRVRRGHVPRSRAYEPHSAFRASSRDRGIVHPGPRTVRAEMNHPQLDDVPNHVPRRTIGLGPPGRDFERIVDVHRVVGWLSPRLRNRVAVTGLVKTETIVDIGCVSMLASPMILPCPIGTVATGRNQVPLVKLQIGPPGCDAI